MITDMKIFSSIFLKVNQLIIDCNKKLFNYINFTFVKNNSTIYEKFNKNFQILPLNINFFHF